MGSRVNIFNKNDTEEEEEEDYEDYNAKSPMPLQVFEKRLSENPVFEVERNGGISNASFIDDDGLPTIEA